MNFPVRLATLALAVAVGLTAAPSRGADATLARDQSTAPPSGAEHWALRPTRVALATAMSAPPAKTVPLSDLPAERRNVRIVYQGYSEAAPLGMAR